MFSFPVGTEGLVLVWKKSPALSAPILGGRAPSKKVVTPLLWFSGGVALLLLVSLGDGDCFCKSRVLVYLAG